MTIQEFISLHLDDDVRTLALKAPKDADFDIGYALDQIAGRQKARTKLPIWAANDRIVYPPHISMEQCSSERTARYKAALAERLIRETHPKGHTTTENITKTSKSHGDFVLPEAQTVLTDLTGGFGVDFSYMAAAFSRAVYVERQSHLCELSRHNMEALGITQAEVINADSEEYLRQAGPSTVIFADPARRDMHGARTFAVADCTPDVLGMKELLLDKSCFTVLKLSPMLDWRKAVSDFGSCAGEVHIVASGGECKELLLVLSRHYDGLERIFCANDNGSMSYKPEEAAAAERREGRFVEEEWYYGMTATEPHDADNSGGDGSRMYLYEPDAAVMKAGCHALVACRHGVREISRDSHLMLSHRAVRGFPGRAFTVEAATTMNKRELKTALREIKKANITARNFPLKVAELRRRLKISEGGDTYIFATTTQTGRHLLLICRKA